MKLARLREGPTARELGLSDATLHNWLKQAESDEGQRDGLTTEERTELVRLHRANRPLAMENEILKQPLPTLPASTPQIEVPAGL